MFGEMARAHRRRWTHEEELLALILEQLSALVNLTRFVNTKESERPSRVPKAFRYPRPIKPPRPRPSTLDEIRRFFSAG